MKNLSVNNVLGAFQYTRKGKQNIFHSILQPKTGPENNGDSSPLSILQALTRHPFTQKLNKYCTIQLQKKLVYFLSKADRVHRVENLMFRNMLLSWLTLQTKKMAKELRSPEKIVSSVGGVLSWSFR